MVNKYTGNRDPRFVRVQRGGTLEDSVHQSLALWAAACAQRVLPLFENARPDDVRPREAINAARAWANGDISMMQARDFAFAAHAAAREVKGAASEAARAAGHAVATAHMADHELGGAYFALRAVMTANPDSPEIIAEERSWQLKALTPDIRDLVIDDMHKRAGKFKSVFTEQ